MCMQRRQPKPRATSISILEPRRSSRARNVVSYRDDVSIGYHLFFGPVTRKCLKEEVFDDA